MLVYLFPGQGSQTLGMGKTLFNDFPDYVTQADNILGYSIKTLCLEDPNQQLNQTQYTQPALYIVNALTYLKKLQENKPKPDFVAGHSLGEYNALLAANVIDFKTGLTLVKKRGELMARATGGSMAAIIGLTIDEVEQTLQQHQLSQIDIANYNSYKQVVISGLKQNIEAAEKIFKSINNVTMIPLKVSGAFHSRYMQPAQTEFNEFLKNYQFGIPTMPVIANSNAAPYHPAITQSNLANQITSTVQWTPIIRYLITQGEITFEEIGVGNVLSGLVRKIKLGE